ncbi:hypothetical protein EG68_04078 [Paragonimus skrjabini miyazakii]|uniref:Uncharacterized protein n=1 Tax=Paragonimus skrjabini miyazakii TaxID=59628 RepID=A0A8S9YU87_9TREM|nr:hypothetical protein EG68_04078 [Paragonimus skrjabini miyazakii]
MATSAVALGKLEMCRRRELSIPDGWAADDSGKSTNDPAVGISKGALMPLGGSEHTIDLKPNRKENIYIAFTGGYKGYGLGMMVELFCGILSGAQYGSNIRQWMKTERPANLGQGFVAIDPNAFGFGFEDRLSDYMRMMRELPRVDDSEPVLVPGDPERRHMAECDAIGGIPYPPVLIESMASLEDSSSVEVILFKT